MEVNVRQASRSAFLMMMPPSSPQEGKASRGFPGTTKHRCTSIHLLLLLVALVSYGRLFVSRIVSRSALEGAEISCKDNEQLKALTAFKEQLARCTADTKVKQLHMDELSLEITDARERRRGVESNLPEWRRPFGEDCKARDRDLARFLNYTSGHQCPDDWPLVQELLFKYNCLHLPKRACFAPTPEDSREPLPLPQSLWMTPPDGSVRWANYKCKSFECLQLQLNGDCPDCFRLEAAGRKRLPERPEALDIEGVLALKMGTVRVGLDVGGNTGEFAARMALRNVTIITTSVNEGAPFMETMALRGVVPLFLPPLQRLPFFENALDIIHCTETAQSVTPDQFELMAYDWDRVLRPGGILWLQSFHTASKLTPQYLHHLEALKYKQHEWILEERVPMFGTEISRLTAVLEKPIEKPKERKRGSDPVR